MSILIIGGSGFVGSRLIYEAGESNCINLDKNKSLFYPEITTIGDVRKPEEIFIDKNIKTIVLLAAEHKDNVSPISLYHDVNVKGTKNVLDAMDRAGVKNLIFTSSVAIYGLNKINPDEEHPEDPINHYGESKWEAEKLIKKWYEKDPLGKSINIIRPSVIFGERNRGNAHNLLKQIIYGKFIMIGKGQNKKSMAYIGNIVKFIKNRIEYKEEGYHIFNYADKPDISMNDLVKVAETKMNISTSQLKVPFWIGMLGGYGFDLLALITRKEFSISSVRVKKFCATTQFNAKKAHSKFEAPFSLEEGLNRTMHYEFVSPKSCKLK